MTIIETPFMVKCYEVLGFYNGDEESMAMAMAAHYEAIEAANNEEDYWDFGGDNERDFDFCSFDGEPIGSFDGSDDAEALASAGHGMDEDYGYYGD